MTLLQNQHIIDLENQIAADRFEFQEETTLQRSQHIVAVQHIAEQINEVQHNHELL